MNILAHCRNGHDDGFEIYTGQDVSGGRLVGKVYVDGDGLVLRIYDSTGSELIEYTYIDHDDLIEGLADEGYMLDDNSLAEVAELWKIVNAQ